MVFSLLRTNAGKFLLKRVDAHHVPTSYAGPTGNIIFCPLAFRPKRLNKNRSLLPRPDCRDISLHPSRFCKHKIVQSIKYGDCESCLRTES